MCQWCFARSEQLGQDPNQPMDWFTTEGQDRAPTASPAAVSHSSVADVASTVQPHAVFETAASPATRVGEGLGDA